jgi:hypothetical protein
MSDTEGKVVSQSDFASWVADLQKTSPSPLPDYAPFYFPSPRVKGA